MKRYAILMALAAMLLGTEARAANIGFDGMTPGGLFGGTEAGFIIAPNGTNDWTIVGAGGNNFASSTLNGSSFYVESSVLDEEFTVQGFDVSSIGGGSIFFIVGLADRDDQNAELFRFSYSVTDDPGFERILLADVGRRLTSAYSGPNGSFNVGLDKVQRVIFSVSHDPNSNITSRMDCVDVGPGSNTCSAPGGGGGGNVPEPASLLLLGAGLAGIGIWRRKAMKRETGV